MASTGVAVKCARCQKSGHNVKDCALPFFRNSTLLEGRMEAAKKRADYEAYKKEVAEKTAAWEAKQNELLAKRLLRKVAGEKPFDTQSVSTETESTAASSVVIPVLDEEVEAEVERKAAMDKDVRKFAKMLREIVKLEDEVNLEPLQQAKLDRKPEIELELDTATSAVGKVGPRMGSVPAPAPALAETAPVPAPTASAPAPADMFRVNVTMLSGESFQSDELASTDKLRDLIIGIATKLDVWPCRLALTLESQLLQQKDATLQELNISDGTELSALRVPFKLQNPGVSRYNAHYYCTVRLVEEVEVVDNSEGIPTMTVDIFFEVVGNGALGQLQDPRESKMAMRMPDHEVVCKLCSSHAFDEADWSRCINGSLRFTVDADVKQAKFTFGESGYSTIELNLYD